MPRIARLVCLTVLFPLLPCVSHARLTEKEDELIKRFGPYTGRSEEMTSFESRSYAVGPVLTFKADQWTIHTLLIEGRCARITYSKVGGWTDEQLIGLLERNGGYGTYTLEKSMGKSYRKWKQRDGTVALFSGNTLTLTHPLYDRHLATLKAKAEAISKQPPKF